MQGQLAFAIVDEVDSILIDEARTPLVISGATEDSSELYKKINRLIPSLKPDLEDDPGESRDLSKEHPAIVAQMQALAEKKRAELGDEATKIKGSENREPGRAEIADWAKPKKK